MIKVRRAKLLFALNSRRRRQLWYVPVLALAMGLMMMRLFVLARVLGVEDYGILSNGLLVSSTFCMFGCLGLQLMLQRDSPGLFVRGQERRAALLTVQSCLAALIIFVVGALGGLLGATFGAVEPTRFGAGLLHGLSQQIFVLSTVESRSRGHVLHYAAQNLARSVVAFILGVFVAYATESALWALVSEAIATFLFSSTFLFRTFNVQRERFFTLCCLAVTGFRKIQWRVALTLVGNATIAFLICNGDRWLALTLLDLRDFALYSFGWIVVSIANSSQVLINASVFPLIARRFSQFGKKTAFSISARLSVGLIIAMSVLSIPGYYVFVYVVNGWFPDYVESLSIVPVFVLISVVRLSDFWSSFLLVCGMEKVLLNINLFSLASVVIVLFVLSSANLMSSFGMEEIAYLALTGSLISSVLAALMSLRNRF